MRRIHLSVRPLGAVRPASTHKVGFKPSGWWYGCNDEWERWVDENWKSRHWRYKYSVQVFEEKILMIRSKEDLLVFNEEFGVVLKEDFPGYSPDFFNAIDWPRVAETACGIEICPHQDDLTEDLEWYATWSIASGVIWNPAAIKSVRKL